jgi:hypothetical protein
MFQHDVVGLGKQSWFALEIKNNRQNEIFREACLFKQVPSMVLTLAEVSLLRTIFNSCGGR